MYTCRYEKQGAPFLELKKKELSLLIKFKEREKKIKGCLIVDIGYLFIIFQETCCGRYLLTFFNRPSVSPALF